jgi:hypothetical protein
MGSGASSAVAMPPLIRRSSSTESEYYTPPTEPFANDPFPTQDDGPGAVAWRKFVETGVLPDEVFADDGIRREMLAFVRSGVVTEMTDDELTITAPWVGQDEVQNGSDHLVTGKFVCGVFVPEYEQQFPVKPQHDPEWLDEFQIRGRPVPRYPLDVSAHVFVPGALRHSRKRTRSDAGLD